MYLILFGSFSSVINPKDCTLYENYTLEFDSFSFKEGSLSCLSGGAYKLYFNATIDELEYEVFYACSGDIALLTLEAEQIKNTEQICLIRFIDNFTEIRTSFLPGWGATLIGFFTVIIIISFSKCCAFGIAFLNVLDD